MEALCSFNRTWKRGGEEEVGREIRFHNVIQYQCQNWQLKAPTSMVVPFEVMWEMVAVLVLMVKSGTIKGLAARVQSGG